MAIREIGLGRSNDQDPKTGIPVAPVTNSPSGDSCREQKVLFNQLTVDGDTTGPGSVGLMIPIFGYGVQVSPASDPSTVIYVSLDDSANYVRLTPGMRYDVPFFFDRIFVKKSTNLPNTSAAFWLTSFQQKAARITAGPPSPNEGTIGAGSPQWATTITTLVGGAAAVNVCPFRQGRRYVRVQNRGPGDVYIAPSNAVSSTLTGTWLPAGKDTLLDLTADVFAWGQNNSVIDCTEVFNVI